MFLKYFKCKYNSVIVICNCNCNLSLKPKFDLAPNFKFSAKNFNKI